MVGYKNKQVLVTGAAGFVGACLTRRLLDIGAEVHILTRERSDRWRLHGVENQLHDHRVDLLDKEKLKRIVAEVRPRIVFHLAAHGGYPFQVDTDRILQANLLGTANLIEALSGIDYECLVHAGSSSEYGLNRHPMFEEDVLEPISAYAVSKAASTLLCQALARTRDQPLITLRLFSVYGYYEEPSRMIPSVIDQCLRRVDPVLGPGTQVRDFVFVDDVLHLFLAVGLARPVRPEIVNVGSGIQRTVREVVEKIVAVSGAKVFPKWGALAVRPFEPTMWVANISKAKNLYHWEPMFSLDEGLRLTIDWQRQRLASEVVDNTLAGGSSKQ